MFGLKGNDILSQLHVAWLLYFSCQWNGYTLGLLTINRICEWNKIVFDSS